jgi:3-oxoacyl-[acyl-carrier-protein] synthase II
MLQAEEWLHRVIQKERTSPSLLRGLLPDRTATLLATTYGLAGYQGTITTACSSSATAIGWGADLIAGGEVKAVLCGGADSLSLLTFAGFNSLKVVDPQPCSPFSLGRQGISLGEGAAFLVLEAEEAAKERGASIYGYLSGYAVAEEAHHMTAPEPTGGEAARVMGEALKSAGLEQGHIGWVNAHGTGTPLNDQVEARAVHLLFGDDAPGIPLVSIKGLTGHCLGAAGAIEAVGTIIALNDGFVPATLNFRGADPQCPVDCCAEGPRSSSSSVALSNSFAFGGNITTLVLSRGEAGFQ